MPKYFDQIRTDETRAQQAYLVLIGLAAERKTTTYNLLAKTVGFKGAGVFAGILGHIMFWCEQNDLPALTTVVVGTDTGRPGTGLSAAKDREAARERVFAFRWYRLVPPTPAQLDRAFKQGLGKRRKP